MPTPMGSVSICRRPGLVISPIAMTAYLLIKENLENNESLTTVLSRKNPAFRSIIPATTKDTKCQARRSNFSSVAKHSRAPDVLFHQCRGIVLQPGKIRSQRRLILLLAKHGIESSQSIAPWLPRPSMTTSRVSRAKSSGCSTTF
jgi:hypothetical protein